MSFIDPYTENEIRFLKAYMSHHDIVIRDDFCYGDIVSENGILYVERQWVNEKFPELISELVIKKLTS